MVLTNCKILNEFYLKTEINSKRIKRKGTKRNNSKSNLTTLYKIRDSLQMHIENFIQSQAISLIDKARSVKQEMFVAPMIALSVMI